MQPPDTFISHFTLTICRTPHPGPNPRCDANKMSKEARS